jgi:1-pyrroline-5-carboxylate dehydrogenase
MATKVTYTSTSLPDDAANEAFEAAVREVRASPREHRLVIDGEHRPGGGGTFQVFNPANRDELLGTFAEASADDVAEAVDAAKRSFDPWRHTSPEERVRILRAAANIIRERVSHLSAVAALEVGKNRVEAVGEVEESADLIDEYCRQMEEHHGYVIEMRSGGPGERNVSILKPFGVFAVIAPFNFPSALSAGPISGALVAGNTVVYKPAETTPLSGVLLVEILHEAGVPAGALNLVTGGPETGKALAQHRGVDGIVFTGSYEVGQIVAEEFGRGTGYARPAIIEMGGKNPTIVTAKADLGKAAVGVARSAFGSSGQKCSACSRVLVEEAVHDAFLERLAEETGRWVVADPTEDGARLGPVNNREGYERFRQSAAAAERDGRIVAGGHVLDQGALAKGFFVEPTVVADLPPGHPLTRDELFMPFVVVEKVRDLDEALARANDTIYGLTAGIFSEDEEEVQRFFDRIEAGVVYANRDGGATTGAWPGFQSFPGWKGSGSTGKGGLGPYYVQQFLREQSQTVIR